MLSKFGFLEGPKVETEMLSVKMHQTEATSWNQTKSEIGIVAAKKATTEATRLLERERVRTIEQVILDLHAKEGASSQRGAFPGVQRREWEGQRRIEELCSKFYNRTQDFWRQHTSGTPAMSCCGEEKSFLDENHKWVNIMALQEFYGPGSESG